MADASRSTAGWSAGMPLFEMASPFAVETGRLLLLEPPWARPGELRARLLDERYDKPFVVDDGERRYLYFNVRLMQSAMRLDAPNALDLRYTQQMLACLLFQPHPRRLFLIGLGGGSLVKFCHHRLPGAHLTAVELSPEVIALAEAFKVPPPGPRLHLIEGDGARVLATTEKGLDVVLVDAFDAEGFAPGLANREFLENVCSRLAGNGILVVNLAGDPASYAGLIRLALEVFADQVIVLPVPEDGNHLLFAFRQFRFEPRWRALQPRARELRSQLGLDFPAMLERLERAWRLGNGRYRKD